MKLTLKKTLSHRSNKLYKVMGRFDSIRLRMDAAKGREVFVGWRSGYGRVTMEWARIETRYSKVVSSRKKYIREAHPLKQGLKLIN